MSPREAFGSPSSIRGIIVQCPTCKFLTFLDLIDGKVDVREGFKMSIDEKYLIHAKCNGAVQLFRMTDEGIPSKL